MIAPSKLMATSEVANRLGCSRQNVSQRVKAGSLTPVHRLPGSRGAYLFDAAYIERVAAAQAGGQK